LDGMCPLKEWYVGYGWRNDVIFLVAIVVGRSNGDVVALWRTLLIVGIIMMR